MLFNEMSAIETEPINTTDTNTSDTMETLLPEPRRVELLRMTLRNLKALLDASGLSINLEQHLSTRLLENLDSEVVVLATTDTGEWPREPPPVEERRMVTAVADTSVLANQDAFIASNLEPDQVKQGAVTTRFVSTAEQIAVLLQERLCLSSHLAGSMTVAGLVVEEEPRFASAFNSGVAVPGLRWADQRTLESSRTVRRSHGLRSTRTGSHWDKGTVVAAGDGFNQPPDVG
jgi:hypothetical protein